MFTWVRNIGPLNEDPNPAKKNISYCNVYLWTHVSQLQHSICFCFQHTLKTIFINEKICCSLIQIIPALLLISATLQTILYHRRNNSLKNNAANTYICLELMVPLPDIYSSYKKRTDHWASQEATHVYIWMLFSIYELFQNEACPKGCKERINQENFVSYFSTTSRLNDQTSIKLICSFFSWSWRNNNNDFAMSFEAFQATITRRISHNKILVNLRQQYNCRLHFLLALKVKGLKHMSSHAHNCIDAFWFDQ